MTTSSKFGLKAAAAFFARSRATDYVVAACIVGAAVFAFASTAFLVSSEVETASRLTIIALLAGNVLIALIFGVLVGWRFLALRRAQRHGLAGARMHVRLVVLFSAVAVAPAIVAFAFSAMAVRSSLEDVFSGRIERAVNTAREFANVYFAGEANRLGEETTLIAYDIDRVEKAGAGLERNPIGFRQYLTQQASLRNLAGLYLLDGNRRIIAHVQVKPDVRFNLPSEADFNQIDAADNVPGRFKFDANDPVRLNIFRGALKLDGYGGGYLITYKAATPGVSNALIAVRTMRDDYLAAEHAQRRAERVLALGFVMLAIIILFGAIWLGLWAATSAVRPIGRLVSAAERISSGDLNARVAIEASDGELGELARAFNRMTAQLQTQRNDLIETNRQFDKRRRFTETVLSGVSAGVIGLSPQGRVTIANRSAARLLKLPSGRFAGAPLSEIAPELEPLIAEAFEDPAHRAAGQVELIRDGEQRTLNVRIAGDALDEAEFSYVVTFDDITQLISAQRSAAWGDVARRIAHEIKNPLTPIQLSAERLRRKYRSEITTSPDVFERCTETIVRQVADIRRMVDEFSSFARMPKPVAAREDVGELIRSAAFPQKVAAPDIEFELDLPDQPVWAECDGRLIVQALTNVMKNAAESVAARIAEGPDDPQGRLRVVLRADDEHICIDVIDNGLGLPTAARHRLTEPYMTTREKGTGLGLAIVKKIMEEHGGALELSDDARLGASGARVRMVMPALPPLLADAAHGHTEAAE